MDPNANLEEQRELAVILQQQDFHKFTQQDLATAAQRLAELVLALDEWLVRGGFMPDRWANNVEWR